MNITIKMPIKLRRFYKEELWRYRLALKGKHYHLAWRHLERAHILAQRYPYEHTSVHWEMIRFGIRIKDFREVLGQLPRLMFGGVKSFVGKVPVGNTGGANVPALQPMEMPDDLARIINNASR